MKVQEVAVVKKECASTWIWSSVPGLCLHENIVSSRGGH